MSLTLSLASDLLEAPHPAWALLPYNTGVHPRLTRLSEDETR